MQLYEYNNNNNNNNPSTTLFASLVLFGSFVYKNKTTTTTTLIEPVDPFMIKDSFDPTFLDNNITDKENDDFDFL